MLDESFSKGDSLFHRLDCRVKIIVTIILVGIIAATNSLITAAGGLTLAVMMNHLAKLPFLQVLKRLLVVNSFTLLLWLILPFTYPGETFRFAGVTISSTGCLIAGLITLKTNAILLLIIVFLSTSTVAAIGHSLQSLGVPDRLTFLLLFSYRNILVIYNEYKKLYCAALMRNFVPTTSMHTYRTYAYLFGMTLVKSWNRGEKIHEAMIMRGFDGKLHSLNHPVMQKGDYVFLVLNLFLATALLSLNLLS